MSNTSSNSSPTVLLDGLAYVESPRWHEGRLWFAHWGTGEIVAVDLDGTSEVTGHGPAGLGWSIDWLPDGRLLVTGKELLRREPDGSMVRHADLSGISSFGWNEVVVDGRGNIYLNSINFGFLAGEQPKSGIIALVTPDGSARQVAGDLAFPNGMVITPDNKTLIISESFTGRLIAFDIEATGLLSNRRVWAEGLVLHWAAHRLRYRSHRPPVQPAGVGRGPPPRRHLPRRRWRHLGPDSSYLHPHQT